MKWRKLLALVAVLSIAVPPIGAATHFVDTLSPCPGAGSEADPYCSISTAIFFSGMSGDADDIIVVKPGTYSECVIADLGTTGSLHLIAEANDRVSTTIDPAGSCPGDPAVTLIGTDMRIEGFTITGGEDSGILAGGNVVITNNLITTNDSPTLGGGIFVSPGDCNLGDTSALIENNRIETNTAEDGAGIYLLAAPDSAGGCATLGDPLFTVSNNEISGNTAGFTGGGIAFFVDTPSTSEAASVVITNNLIDTNIVGDGTSIYAYGGGLYGSSYGYGVESVTIDRRNTFRSNVSNGFGGAMFVEINSATTSTKTIRVDGNTIDQNTSTIAGGGIDARVLMGDLIPGQVNLFEVTHNQITNNTTNNPAQENSGGGGISASVIANRSEPELSFNIAFNEISGNRADLDGGGAELLVTADGDPGDGNPAGSSFVGITFANNRVTSNETSNDLLSDSIGGGVFAKLTSVGLSLASIDLRLNTISDNRVQLGAGGIEVEMESIEDVDLVAGILRLDINSTIVSDNESFGIGGPAPGAAGLFTGNQAGPENIDIKYSDFFANAGGNYEAWVGDRTDTPSKFNLAEDPLLDGNYLPAVCSPTIDAGDPTLPVTLAISLPIGGEGGAHRGLVNMGHTGGTADAVAAIADINGDGLVDGIDVVRLATGFGTVRIAPPSRYAGSGGDLNPTNPVRGGVDMIDGDDLSFVSADFGQTCP